MKMLWDRIYRSPDGAAGGGGEVAPASAPASSAPSSAPAVSPAPSSPQPGPATIASTGGLTDGAMPNTSLFEALATDYSDARSDPHTDSPPAQASEQTPPAPPQASQPAVAPQPTPAAQPTPATETTAPQTLEPPPSAASASPQASLPWTPETIAQLEMPENREQLLDQMAAAWQFTPEEMTGLATDAAPVLSRFAARILYAASLHTLSTLRQFNEGLPSRFNEFRESAREYDTHEEAFKRMWPALADPKFADDIRHVSERVTKIPGMTQQGVYVTVGRTIAAMYGLNATPNMGTGVAPSGQPIKQTVQPAPFSPAASGGGSPIHSSANGATHSPWEILGISDD